MARKKINPDLSFMGRMQRIVDAAGGQNSLSRMAGIAQATLRPYLNGSEPTRPQLVALAKAANCSISWLATGEEETTATIAARTSAIGSTITGSVIAEGCFSVNNTATERAPTNPVADREHQILERMRRHFSPARWERLEAELDELERNNG